MTATSHQLDSGGPPPLLSIVPVAGPAVSVYVGFPVVLLLLLVPPFALLATLLAVALVVATALVVLVALAAVIVRAPFVLVRFLRGTRPAGFSVPVPQMRKVKLHRV
jgi:hypothetical protein